MDDFLSSIGMRYLLLNAHQIGIRGVTGINFANRGTLHFSARLSAALNNDYISYARYHNPRSQVKTGL